MQTLLGYWTGLAFVAPELGWGALVGTAIAVNAFQAILCRVIAHNSGRALNLWTAIGFVAGLWAVIVLVLLPRGTRAPASSRKLSAPSRT